MQLMRDFSNTILALLFQIDSKTSISETDVGSYGVGAMMPLEMQDELLLDNTAQYGV